MYGHKTAHVVGGQLIGHKGYRTTRKQVEKNQKKYAVKMSKDGPSGNMFWMTVL